MDQTGEFVCKYWGLGLTSPVYLGSRPVNESSVLLPAYKLMPDYKQLLDEVFVISGIIKVEVSVISRSQGLRLITLTEALF